MIWGLSDEYFLSRVPYLFYDTVNNCEIQRGWISNKILLQYMLNPFNLKDIKKMGNLIIDSILSDSIFEDSYKNYKRKGKYLPHY